MTTSKYLLLEKIFKKQKNTSTSKGTNYATYDLPKQQNAIDSIYWTTFLDENNPNRMWDIYLENITSNIDALYPVKNLLYKSAEGIIGK